MPEKLKVYSPYDGSLISELDMDDEESALKKLEVAYALASKPENLIPLPRRIEILEKAADIVEERMEDYAKQSANEGGKPLMDSRIELARAVQGIREAARSINHLIGREIPMGLTASSLNRKAFTFREPIGVVVARIATVRRPHFTSDYERERG